MPAEKYKSIKHVPALAGSMMSAHKLCSFVFSPVNVNNPSVIRTERLCSGTDTFLYGKVTATQQTGGTETGRIPAWIAAGLGLQNKRFPD